MDAMEMVLSFTIIARIRTLYICNMRSANHWTSLFLTYNQKTGEILIGFEELRSSPFLVFGVYK